MPPRRKTGLDLPRNLYSATDSRDGVTRYRWKDPRNGKFHGMGTDKDSAIKDADALNTAIYGYRREVVYLDASPEKRTKRPRPKSQRPPISSKIRFEIFNRDNFTCRYCGRSSPQVKLHVDHIHPVALGGSNDPSNLTTACADCNLGKSDRTLYQNSNSASEKVRA